MKKKITFTMLVLLGMTQAVAQEYEYVPFVREGVKWVCYYNNQHSDIDYQIDHQFFKPGKTYFTLELKGDVEINGIVYKALHKYSGDAIDPENDTVLICLREQDKVVYGIVPDGRYPGYFIGYGLPYQNDYPYNEMYAGNEFVLYDFSDTDTWCQWIYRRNPEWIVSEGTDLIEVGGKPATRHRYQIVSGQNYHMYFIEGIGVDGYNPCYPLAFLNQVDYSYYPYYLSHVVDNGEIIYKGINYEYIAPWDERLPIARDGVKWVNERVIINHGDTTRYYYTYELKGEDKSTLFRTHSGFMYCHYYTGEAIDPENDSIICSMAEIPYSNCTWVSENPAMDKMEAEGRNMLQRRKFSQQEEHEELYMIFHDNPRNIYNAYYSWQVMEKPYSINKNSFFEVEPVEIDGHECRRYAFVGDDGEPQAYVVEGIGFDSRDMGDLLTPFTRKPDPDADYQEYCGLSHVIKDGKIIYKGMRYREEAPVSTIGDVNGDGQVTIADVTALIDLLLNGGTPRFTAACDLNRDQNVSIADVTALIDLLLNGE